MSNRAGQILDSVKEVVDKGKESAKEVVDEASEKAEDVISSVKSHSADIAHNVGESTSTAADGIAKLFHDNPIAIGIIVLLIGAAIGLAVPRTEPENQILGAARKRLGEKSKDAADDLKHKALDVASEVVDTVKDQLKSQFGAEV